jgi:putative transcriptional regulator
VRETMYQPEKLKARRKELKLTQKDIADQLGISYQAYSAWERGIKTPSREKVKLLEQILNVPKGYFTEVEIVRLYNSLSDDAKDQALSYVRNLVQKEQCKKVVSISAKLYEYHVYEQMSAGIGSSVYNDQNYDTVYFNEELAHDFASWISGDSMEPKYPNGSVALIRETGFDYDGAVYAVVWNSQTFIKKVYREENGLRLVSINKDYKNIQIPYNENPRIVGKIVGDFMPLEV